MTVEVDGAVDDRGMVLDFQELKQVLKPLVEAWDHATLVHSEDKELLAVLEQQEWKHYVLPFDTTSENVARYAADYLCREMESVLHKHGVEYVSVKIQETDTCYATFVRHL